MEETDEETQRKVRRRYLSLKLKVAREGCDTVPVTFNVGDVSDVTGKKLAAFSETFLFPEVLVREATRDPAFARFVMADLHNQMGTKMMAAGPWKCTCGQPAQHFSGQLDYVVKSENAFEIFDLAPTPLCGNLLCKLTDNRKSSQFMSEVAELKVEGNDLLLKEYCICKTCGSHKDQKKLLRCGICKVTYYCSRACQKKDWNEHKKTCNADK